MQNGPDQQLATVIGTASAEKTSTRPVGRCLTSAYLQYWRASLDLLCGMVALIARPRRAVKPNAAQRRAEGAGLDGEGADRAIIRIAAM
jgi:hypothetical protein